MISCVITTLKVNKYQRKNDFLRINFIKKSDHAFSRVGPTECILLGNMTISEYTSKWLVFHLLTT